MRRGREGEEEEERERRRREREEEEEILTPFLPASLSGTFSSSFLSHFLSLSLSLTLFLISLFPSPRTEETREKNGMKRKSFFKQDAINRMKK